MHRHDPTLLHDLAAKVGTPYWLYDAGVLRERIATVKAFSDVPGMQARFAMKACPLGKILAEMRRAGIWIDAVSGNEVLRALRAGFSPGYQVPKICFTADVFRDNALEVVMQNQVLPNVGSPGMISQLASAGYRGPVSIRVNPGFGHGHVNACDTGGPSSKHGVWYEDLEPVRRAAEKVGFTVTMIHAHIGSGPLFEELCENLARLADDYTRCVGSFQDLEGVSLGGGIPHNYRDPQASVPVDSLHQVFVTAAEKINAAAGRRLRLEIEPGRFFVAPCATLVTRVHDVKSTRTNAKGNGATFAMVDAGFVDLIRPAMYGSYHRIEVVGVDSRPAEPIVVAGPLCESGDVFTRDDAELLQPRELPRPKPGDLLTLHDAGAYGYAMSCNYNSIGRAPQLWLEEDGTVECVTRRETLDDILATESQQWL